MDVLINYMGESISQYICMSNHHNILYLMNFFQLYLKKIKNKMECKRKGGGGEVAKAKPMDNICNELTDKVTPQLANTSRKVTYCLG